MTLRLYLGIDTGGTHTDVVVYDPRTKTVVSRAKAETTHNDLAIGISNALAELAGQKWDGGLEAIERINLSTTLATNSIAEGLSNRVALVLIGYDKEHEVVQHLVQNLPLVRPVFVAGGHDFYGRQEADLDNEALLKHVQELDHEVSGWAVSGFFSVKNPTHEVEAARLIKKASKKPVTLGCELTGQLDAVRRAATAALNAGLIIIINRLLDAVKQSAAEIGLDKAKLMVVKGDGTLVSEDWAREKPIETVVSGPAAGLVGANILAHGFLSAEEKNLWVLDIGGTTTDMAFVRDGLPEINPNGARVGRWDTMTAAVETRTRGLGGDSLATMNNDGLVTLGPRRVMPLCRLASLWPDVLYTLKAQKGFNTAGTVAGYFFIPGTPPAPGMNEDEVAILHALKTVEMPLSMARYSEMAFDGGRHFAGLRVLSHPAVMISSFTPTDAMSVLGLYNGGVRAASVLGAEILGRNLKLKAEDVARRVLDEFGRILSQMIVSYGLARDGAESDDCDYSETGMFGAAMGRREHNKIEVALKALDTIILLGAPVNVLSPFLGKFLQGRILVPPTFDVASAVGAAASPIHLVRRVDIHALPNFKGYRMFLPDEVVDSRGVESLVGVARRRMDAYMRNLAVMAGAKDFTVHCERVNKRVNLKDGSRLDLGAHLTFSITQDSH